MSYEDLKKLAEVLYTCLWIELTGRVYKDAHAPGVALDLAEAAGLKLRKVMVDDE